MGFGSVRLFRRLLLATARHCCLAGVVRRLLDRQKSHSGLNAPGASAFIADATATATSFSAIAAILAIASSNAARETVSGCACAKEWTYQAYDFATATETATNQRRGGETPPLSSSPNRHRNR